ncbi:uncharacterized protein TNCV_2333151 [Trichonephila clavipes]|nr:uncharacterized protein TNCV_2333151 [Trichonephila clavipes]
MLFQFVGKLDPCIFLSALKESGFLSVFIIYQIIDNVTVIESFVFNQARDARALRESNGTCIVETVYNKLTECLEVSTFQWRNVNSRIMGGGQDSRIPSGKDAVMFETPMIWREPQNHHDDCYFCVVKINGINPGNRNKWSYPNLSSAQRPLLKSREVQPNTSKSYDPNPCDPERNTSSENSDSDYKFNQEPQPFNHKITK